MIDTAVDVIRKRYDKRHNPVAGDTVCVICSGNGTVYTASNEYVFRGETTENIHAEIIALKKMQEDGQTKVKAVTVFNSCTSTPLLPCNGCISCILSLNPENVHALVVTPNGNMLITDVGRFAAGPDFSQTRMSGGYYSVYTDFPDTNRGASLYSNPSGGFMPNMSMQVNMPPVYGQNVSDNTASPVKYTPENTPKSVSPPQRSEQMKMSRNGVNNILKNKLNSLFNED